MARTRILVVDDEIGMLEVCAAVLKKLPEATVLIEQDGRHAADRWAEENLDLLVLDIRMPGTNGLEILRSVRQRDANIAVLMMTAFPSVETAVECMKLGAADYITKPFLPEDFLATVKRLLDAKTLREENRLLQRRLERIGSFGDIIGNSQAMQAVFRTIKQIAATNVDVLILGETGTGKELVARSIHKHSERCAHRFVPVDSAAIPEDLLESELFGHERGAFTGAHTRSLGLLEFANRGTFFLDEVAELPARLQVKLLRTLQERRLRRVGSTGEIEVDVRVISATSRDLEREIEQNRFRADLYYRLNVARIDIPPLRERKDDIPLLVGHFIDRYAPEMGKDVTEVNSDALEILTAYTWPGNVRELQNVIKRALTVTDGGALSPNDLPDNVVVSAHCESGKNSIGYFGRRDQEMNRFERQYLQDLLAACSGDVSRAAREAQLPRGTLYRILKKHSLKPDEFRH